MSQINVLFEKINQIKQKNYITSKAIELISIKYDRHIRNISKHQEIMIAQNRVDC